MLEVETPSWGYGDSGTRFATFQQLGRPRDVFERIDDLGALRAHADARGLRIGAVNPNLFQDADYMRQRRARMLECLAEVYAALPAEQELLLEYKPFEPAFYATDLADWGSSLLACQKLGERARVLVDLGHHLHGTNIEQIVAILAAEGRLGGFHFNNRRYADDDLIVGSVNPLELFLIFFERPQCAAMRASLGAAEDPVAELRPYVERIVAERGTTVSVAGGWGR